MTVIVHVVVKIHVQKRNNTSGKQKLPVRPPSLLVKDWRGLGATLPDVHAVTRI